MEFLIIVALALFIWLNAFISRQFQLVANDKGYTEEKYFWICFFLGIVGYILVAALPVKSTSKDRYFIKEGALELPKCTAGAMQEKAVAQELPKHTYSVKREKAVAGNDVYKDCADPVKEANYLTAIALLNSGNYDEAVSIFVGLGNYKDSNEQILKIDSMRRKGSALADK